MKKERLIWCAIGLWILAGEVNAQGIPVIDAANLTQAVQNVVDDAQRFEQLAQTIEELQMTYGSLTGLRNLAAALNNPAFQNYLPPAVYQLYNDVNALGYGGLTTRGKALRDAAMVYNCLELSGTPQINCQAMLAMPYQYKATVNDAQDRSAQRVTQINALMQQANNTTDPKGIAEAAARIDAESALLAHEVTQSQLAGMSADADQRVRSSQQLEAQLANLVRPIR